MSHSLLWRVSQFKNSPVFSCFFFDRKQYNIRNLLKYVELIRHFNKLGKMDVGLAGGKGASLGEMTQAGIGVPEGYVVLSSAFERFIEECDLTHEIDSILHKVNNEDINSIEKASEAIKGLILNAKMPKDIALEINSNFKKLGAKYVAVRSSATSEDSASAAWAGQLDSFLNTSEKDLLENVKKCWASLFTPRAIFYRFEKNLHGAEISVAVVVQKMVESEVSGIAFSVHPVTEDYNQLIIEAGFGLGEAIVSGQITPDSYVVEKSPRRIMDKNVAEQMRGLFRAKNGGNEWVEVKNGGRQKLSDKEILELSELILKIEKHYGFPCDIEWAREGGKFYIVQSRPITTLTKTSSREESLVKKFKREMSGDELLVIRGKFIPLFLLTGWLKFYDDKFKEKEGIYPVLSIKRDKMFTHYISLNKYLSISRKAIVNYIKDPKYKEEITDRYNKIKYKINSFYEDYFNKKNLSEMDLLDILKKTEQYLHEIVALTLFIDFLDEDIVKKTYEERGLKINFDKIFKITQIYDFQSFDLKNNIDLVNNIKKNSEYLKHVYTGYSVAPTKEEVENKLSKINIEDLKKEIEKSKIEISKKSLEKRELRRTLNLEEKSIADFLSWIIELRDDRKPLMNKLDVLLNECVRRVYEKWGTEKNLSFVSYVFEVLKGREFLLDNIPNIKKRRGDFVNLYYGDDRYSEKYENLEEEFEESKSLEKNRSDVGIITGQIASKGKVVGIARIIYDPNRFHSFTEGDILVTSMTRPEFVPIMKKASAIVTNEGGIACHAAIVSRELNKPCIIGTKNATEVIRDGDEIEVDANKGIVRILNRIEEEKKGGKREERKENSKSYEESLLDKYKSEDYERMFGGKAFYYIFGDIFLQYYNSLGVLSIQDSENWMSFLPLISKRKTLEEGRKLYTNKKLFEEYNRDFHQYIKDSSKYFESVLSKPKLSAEEVKKFLDLASKHFSYYAKTEFFYTDLIEQEKMVISIEQFDKLKLDGRSYLNKILFAGDGYLMSLIRKISKQTEVPETDIFFYSIEDLINLVKNKVKIDAQKIKDRHLVFNSREDNIFGEDSKELAKRFISKYQEITKVIRGGIANKGKVQGRARVFSANFKNFDKLALAVKEMQKGEIIVAESTAPEIIAACRKASAIVTNQGGMLSHAAIISRELGIPCIIGTNKNVVLNIHTGDLIEVDANLGIVRILERIEKEESEKDEKIKLSKYMSREHSLFYAHVWSESNRDFFSQTFKDTNIKNMVFLLNDKGILEVYYELKELENVFNKISRGLTENLNLIDKITKEFYKYWNILFPYISGKKKIKNLSEMKELYSNWASWWSPMAELFVIPDIESIPKKIRDKALKVREETQEYGDDGDKVFIDFIEKNYPKYKDVANLLTPEEVFKVDKLSKKEIDLIRKRAEGCALVTFNGSSKLISVSDLEKEAEKKGVVVEGFGNFGESSYFKAFTRDFTLTAVQLWCDTQTIVKKPWAKEMQPVVPYLIFENNEQVVNNYMSGEGVKWDKEQTMKYALENKNFVKMIGEDYIKIISSLREVCKGKNTLSISELKKVLKLAREGWIYFGTMWWLLEDENLYSSKGIDVSRLKKIREEYQDADRLDSLVEESLKKLYPNITNYAKYVLESEILDEDIPSVDELKRRSKYYIYANGKLYTDKSIKDIEVLFNIKIESPVKDENFSEIRGSGKEATKNKYKKEYVRDLPLILVEGFITGISEVYKDITNEDLKYPGMIIFSKEYIIEEWMNDKVIEELTEKIFEENSKGYEFFEKYVNYYKEHLDRYSKIKFFDNIADFKRYIKSLYKALEGFIVFYFSAGNDKTPKEILIRAREIRDKDTLGDDSDKIIRQSFSKIIPYTKNYESVISKEDLDNVPDKKILEKRIGGFVSLPGLFVGLSSLKEFSEKYPQYEFVSAMRDKSILEFKGFSAFKGKVKGRVRILIRKKDMNSLKDGEILVSPMTTPDFLPAMKRASAIVTDEGGIVCHAAIVARELKKPCVIGTKIATQVLRDGDLVEVDANEGIVRILERK